MDKRVKVALPMVLIFAVIIGILAISMSYIYSAIQASASGNSVDALYFALLGSVGIGISIYITYMMRKRTVSQKPLPKIVVTTECKKCGFKSLRKFEKGDYVFKTVGNCEKCNEPMMITSIYAEPVKK